jgi:hypothetical protein
MLGGAGPQPVAPGPAERELCAQCAAEAEALVGAGVRPGDMVVLHDPLTAMLAPALRERGAHAVWFLRRGSAPSDAGGTQAWDFLRPFTAPADAYVVAWSRPSPRGGMIEGVAALIPAGDRVAAKESAPAGHLGWSSMLADVMAGDRGESVGGTRRARPAVAWR